MATNLELCKKLAVQVGITNGGPTDVTSQTAGSELQRIVDWINDAYTEIQGDLEWKWLRKKFTLAISDGDDSYAFGDCTDVDDASAITRFKEWHLADRRNPPKMYLTSVGVSGETLLTWDVWDNFEYLYKTGSIQDQTARPSHISVDPALNIRLGLTPNDSYTVTGTYHKSAQLLTADADVPEMPARYHDLIVYNAMMYYADYKSAPDVERRALKGIRRLRPQLRVNQGPTIRVAQALA